MGKNVRKIYKRKYSVVFEDYSQKVYIADSIRELPELIDNDEELICFDFSDVSSIQYQGIVEIVEFNIKM